MPSPGSNPKRTLAVVVGIAAALGLFVQVPQFESGRTVTASIAEDGSATIEHVKGNQYLSAYLDIAGVPTACDGITAGVRLGQRYTPTRCAQMLEAELVSHADGVLACTPSLRAPGRERQRQAAVLLAYNVGVGAWCGSTARRRFEAGDWKGGCNAFLSWNKARVGGVLRPVAGLTARRQRERATCLSGLPQ